MPAETAKDRVLKRISEITGWGDNPAIVMADLIQRLGGEVDYEETERLAMYLDSPIQQKGTLY